MSVLKNKFQDQEWFKDAASYLSSRFPSVEARLHSVFRYVELHIDNRRTFSYEFASILRDSGSVFSSVLDAFLRGTKSTLKGQYTFSDYRDFLRNEVPYINKLSLHIRPCFPKGTIVPFEELSMATGTPDWWNAYNAVKRSEYIEFPQGNLEHCVTAVSALVLLGFLMGVLGADWLFVNVGIAHDEGSIDMSDERRLFPRI